MPVSLGRSLIASMNGQALTLDRSTGGAYVNGVWEEDDEEAGEVFASVQPLTGDDLMRVPEGDRVKQIYKLYSADELRTGNENTGAQADVVEIDGERYQVKTVEKWPEYWKALVVKIEDASEAP